MIWYWWRKVGLPLSTLQVDLISKVWKKGLEHSVDDHVAKRLYLTIGISRLCQCPYIRNTRIRDCKCDQKTEKSNYVSPLIQVHWKRIITGMVTSLPCLKETILLMIQTCEQMKGIGLPVIVGNQNSLPNYSVTGPGYALVHRHRIWRNQRMQEDLRKLKTLKGTHFSHLITWYERDLRMLFS